jgi:hypothetical protein
MKARVLFPRRNIFEAREVWTGTEWEHEAEDRLYKRWAAG